MPRLKLLAGLALVPALLFGQYGSNSITVTATQVSNVEPDLMLYDVWVTSGLDTTLDTVVGALSSAGITAANFAYVYASSVPLTPGGLALSWEFSLPVSNSKQNDTSRSLSTLQSTIGRNNSGMSLSFKIFGSQLSPRARSCDYSSLIASARNQAQALAIAGNFSLGAVSGLSASLPDNYSSTSTCILSVRYAVSNSSTQTGPNSILITTTQVNPVVPDTVSFEINVQSGLTSVLSDITAALQLAGVGGATFTSVSTGVDYSTNPVQNNLIWSFQLSAPIENLGNRVNALLAAQQAMSRQSSALSLTFFVFTNVPSTPAPCPQAAQMALAQELVQGLATAAGVRVGAILSLSTGVVPVAGQSFETAPIAASVANSITGGQPSPSCTTTVQFQLLY